MTVVIAYADKENKCSYMAADSCASDCLTHSIVKNFKVFNPVGRKDVLLGCAGTFRLPNLLQYVPGIFPDESELASKDIDMSYLINEFTPVIKALTDDFDDDDAWELLIAVEDRIYRMQMDLSIIEPATSTDAIGTGGQVALGAFSALNKFETNRTVEDRIQLALEVACESCQGCMGPFIIKRTEISTTPVDESKRREFHIHEIVRADNDSDNNKKDKNKKNKKKKK